MPAYPEHWILTGYWILFCAIHHITAMEKCKEFFRPIMGKGFRYYRLIYSLIAMASLLFVLSDQLAMKSFRLDISIQLSYLMGVPLGLIGICLMGASIRKYFFKLSGIGVFCKNQHPISLELHGIHKYIRHPLYLGTLLAIWSLFLFFPLLSNFLACTIITFYILIGIYAEEKKLLIIFGEPYKNYRARTPRLVPRIRIQITLLP
jgi:methanethiol S-methyltransferase